MVACGLYVCNRAKVLTKQSLSIKDNFFGEFAVFPIKVTAFDRCVLAILLACLSLNAFAGAIDVYDFKTDSEHKRFQQLSYELRCPKCQNQNLSDSNSQIANDLKNEVARLIREGNTDREIKAFMVDRYGDFVLYNPPVQKNTMVLWWGPTVMLGLGLIVFIILIYQRSRSAAKNEEAASAESASDDGSEKEGSKPASEVVTMEMPAVSDEMIEKHKS